MCPVDVPRVQVLTPVGDVSLTKQAPAAETDVNVIIRNHMAHGIPLFESGNARYGDFSNVGSYQDCLERVRSANDEFMKLPAEVRKACDNDVGVLLDKLANAESREDLVKLGLPVTAIPVSMSDAIKSAFGDMQRLRDLENEKAAIIRSREVARGDVKG